MEERECRVADTFVNRAPLAPRIRDRQAHRDALGGHAAFYVASLYPLLYRLEQRGLITGQWVEKPGQRRRRFYQLTAQGRKMLKHQQGRWREFVTAIDLIMGAENA